MDSRSINELTFGGPTFTFGGPKKYAISKKLSVVSKSGFHQVMLHEMQQKPSSWYILHMGTIKIQIIKQFGTLKLKWEFPKTRFDWQTFGPA